MMHTSGSGDKQCWRRFLLKLSVLAFRVMHRRLSTIVLTFGIVMSFISVKHASGQSFSQEEMEAMKAKGREDLTRLLAQKLPHRDGRIPVYYSPGFETRALRYQRALVEAQQ
jgi:hypothetical protein